MVILTIKKFFRSEDSLAANPMFYALFRFDTITQKAYSLKPNELVEKLLYDFDVSLDDTITVYPIGFSPVSGDSIRIKVINIDSSLIGGTERKRIQLSGVDQNSGYEEFWIEGIGSTFGIFNPGLVGVTISDLVYPELLCFEVEGVLIFDNPNYSDCFEQSTSNLLEGEKMNEIKTYPNPVDENLRISSDYRIKKIELFDYSGKHIFSVSPNSIDFLLNLEKYSDGIIILKIESEKGIVIKRIYKKGL